MKIEKIKIIIYNPNNRNISSLKKYCKNENIVVYNTKSIKSIKNKIKSEIIDGIILSVDDEITSNYIEVTDMLKDVLQPEDANIEIFISTEGYTPNKWQEDILNIKNIKPMFTRESNSLHMCDINWKDTISFLSRIKVEFTFKRISPPKKVRIIWKKEYSPYLEEIELLLRASFKDYYGIIVEPTNQGFSGSICLEIKPINEDQSILPKRYFVKIFKNQGKGFEEYKKYKDYAERLFDEQYLVRYEEFRRYYGDKYCIYVMNLIEGPDGNTLSFSNMIQSSKYSDISVIKITKEIIEIINRFWPSTIYDGEYSLINNYLQSVLNNEERLINLISVINTRSLFKQRVNKENIKNIIESNIGVNYYRDARIYHGDLHCENILIKKSESQLKPIFIDYAKSDRGHALMDFVTLEIDLIMNHIDITNCSIQDFLRCLKRNGGKKLNTTNRKVLKIIKLLRKSCNTTERNNKQIYYTTLFLKSLEKFGFDLQRKQYEKLISYTTYILEELQLENKEANNKINSRMDKKSAR